MILTRQEIEDWIEFNKEYGNDPKTWEAIFENKHEDILTWMLIHQIGRKAYCHHDFPKHHIELLGDKTECQSCGILKVNVK